MNCDGHVTITEDAFRSVFGQCGLTSSQVCDPRFLQSNLNQYGGYYQGVDYQAKLCVVAAAGSLYAAEMVAAVDADLSGHFLASKQRYHFMRAKNETPMAALLNAKQFLREETEAFVQEAAQTLAAMPIATAAGTQFTFTDQFGNRRALVATQGFGPTTRVIPHAFASRPFLNPSRLARALHCLQDSFSPGHTTRREDMTITAIHIYSDQDAGEHGRHDHASGMEQTNRFRQAAAQASAELIELALKGALAGERILSTWTTFDEKWLRASL